MDSLKVAAGFVAVIYSSRKVLWSASKHILFFLNLPAYSAKTICIDM